MIEGKKFKVGDDVYVVPPLNFKQLREHQALIEELNGIDEKNTKMDLLLKSQTVIRAAMSRNYPDITEEKVSEIADLGNFKSLFGAAMGVQEPLPGEVIPATAAA